VGLANTRSRLDRLYEEQAALTIRENPGGGALVDIYLPLRRPAFATGFADDRLQESASPKSGAA
jgi:hypothetical protein